ncbi:MAG: hypothetical protein JWM88_3305 [Verrucomicrobia bacterium]|nr:hypothetical protein [Verrucomicrobiota bacterium]
MSLRETLRAAGLGKLAYQLWHRPVNRLRDIRAAGGPFVMRRTEEGRREMERAALDLPVPAPATGEPLELHLLTGRRFWYQTAFCLWSFAHQTGRRLAPVIYDDGSLAEEFRAPLHRLFPGIVFVPQAEIVARLDDHLPAAKFPVLRERWTNYPNIRKLTDVHAGRAGWKLVLDSDLLFFACPHLLVAWLDRPAGPLHAIDCETSYGYSRPLMNQLAGAPVAELVNVGLTGLNGGEIDWERLEHWTSALTAREGTSYYLEQALIAMLVAGRRCTVASRADYVTLPEPPEALACAAVMHHYVAHSKRWYFQHCWREALKR